ncbi:sonic hedgehog protein A-like, partial [Seriola lalandi dorsalis]
MVVREEESEDQLIKNSVAAKAGGCFPGSSRVILADGGTKPLRELRAGDKVLAADRQGNLVLSDFLMFMDRDRKTVREFHVLETEAPRRRLTLTPAHLVFVMNNNRTDGSAVRPVFTSTVKPGQQLLVVRSERPDLLIPARVTRVHL